MSMQEMFEHDDYPNVENLPSPQPQGQNPEPSREDEWFNGDGDLLEKDDDAPSFAPPLSLHPESIRNRYPLLGPNAIPESSNSSSLASSGRNTPTSQMTGASMGEGHQGSICSNASNSISRSGSSMTRPLLYSAIGSLENLNAASFQNLRQRVGPGKDFSRLGQQQSLLIPPASVAQAQQTKRDVSRTLLAVDSQDLQRQQQASQRKSMESRGGSTGSTRATPLTSNQPVNKATVEKEADTGLAESASPSDKTSSKRLGEHPKASRDSKPSNLRQTSTSSKKTGKTNRKVSIKKEAIQRKKKPVEMFRPSCDAYTPRIEKKRIEYRKAELRAPVEKMSSPMGTFQRPNFRDALRRVAMIIHQHIVKIERRFEGKDMERGGDQGLFKKSMRDTFAESNYCTPKYKCTMVRIPMARPGMIYGLRKIKTKPTIPSEEEIYEFGHQLFKSVQLSSECSIVCLIYVERLMEIAKVPLLANTWRPIFMCCLLLASKVWQDLSSWNIEFASVYPQYSLDAINRLELNFLRSVKWDLYISTSLYAKYYFALRSLVEKVDFRQRYNRLVGAVNRVAPTEAMNVSKRSEQFKEETIMQLSQSM